MNLRGHCQLARYCLLALLLNTGFGLPLLGSEPPNTQERPIIEILNELSENYEVLFTYNSKALRTVDVQFEFRTGEKLESAINRLLNPINYAYESFGEKYYVIFEKSKTGTKTLKKISRHIQKIEKLEQRGNISLQRKNNNKLAHVQSIGNTLEQLQVAFPITGTVTDDAGMPLVGVNILVKGTGEGTVTDLDGKFSLDLEDGREILTFSYTGFEPIEVSVNGQSTLQVTMSEFISQLNEVVVVGYSTTKKVNLTGAVSTLENEYLEDRPVANVQQALQGLVPNLNITTSLATGEPGAEMAMNIRGLTSFEGNNAPYVLVDNIPMSMNDIDPNDIETITVLKDAASTAIYGARAAYGVILITTKSGSRDAARARFTYTSNFGMGTLLNMPENAGHMEFAHTMNASATNAGKQPYYNEDALDRLAQNIANPGSAPAIYPRPDGLGWIMGVEGLGAAAATDWRSIFFKDNSTRQKHNISVAGGGQNINYYVSGGFYDEAGILNYGNEYFRRYNVSATVTAAATPWMDLSFIAKYKAAEEDFPSHPTLGRSFMFLLLTRIKPTKPAFWPDTDVWTGRIGELSTHRDRAIRRQLVLSPRMILKPLPNWAINIDFNYRTNDDRQTFTYPLVPSALPGGIVTYGSQQSSQYRPNMSSNTYLSPNIYSNYSMDFGQHSIKILAGYQHETYKYFNLLATTNYVLTDNIPSVSTSVGTQTVNDQLGHWGIQSLFGRINYSFADKYLLEVNMRRDGSSRFEPGERWGSFPSVSAGWVISKEAFFPLKKQIDFLKFRASFGSIGNQNVANYLYVPTLPIGQSRWLFGGERNWTVGTPDLSSVDLTWEKVNTFDIGLDVTTLNDRLALTFDWYNSRTNNLIGPGIALPAVLGTGVPKQNEGEIRTRGWELEVSWKNRVNSDFSYGLRGVVSDNQSVVTRYTNPTKILTTYYEGQTLGEIWGMQSAGLFQSEAEVTEYPIDQSFIYGGIWFPGDQKYLDVDGDGAITTGDNTADNPGDRVILGNETPRYQFGLNANASWKGFDLSILFQGIGKRDLNVSSLGTFRGPANGPLHATVYTEHVDFWRDASSPLGANPDAYFPRPYDQFTGQNNKNYRFPTDRYLQNGAYIRLKNLQIGYTLPRTLTRKINITNLRVYLSGENIWTAKSLMLYDPEAFNGRSGRIGDQYPLSKIYSTGISINF